MTRLSDAVWLLEEGFCLWVGAGVTRNVAAGYADVPLWDEVTAEMEAAAGIATRPSDFPARLDRASRPSVKRRSVAGSASATTQTSARGSCRRR